MTPQDPFSQETAVQETIAAIATAPGRGGVGIIRVSGPKVPELIKHLVGQALTPRYAHYGDFYHPHTGEVIDTGLALFFPNPHSFTGEDVLELHGHGGPVILDQLLKAVTSIDHVRLAKPGEFSERAFLNDKLDLAQAEAIADLINATSEQAARNAVQSLQGVFSKKVHELVDGLTQLRMYIEAAIDFPEEEIDFLNDNTLIAGIEQLEQQLDALFIEARQGVILQEGMTVVIAGRPNAGKSSLLNALAGRDSAIVTDIPGTTRDVLREHIHLDGMPLHIIDTAGLRDGGDTVEQMGMARAWTEIDKADRILLLVDATTVNQDAGLSELIPEFGRENLENKVDYSRITVIFNKVDLLSQDKISQPAIGEKGTLPDFSPLPQLQLSAKTGAGLAELSQHLQKEMGYRHNNEGGFTARRRHLDALEQAQQWLHQAHQQLLAGAGELVAEDLRQAQQSLGTITGTVTADDLLGHIFSSFCIGK